MTNMIKADVYRTVKHIALYNTLFNKILFEMKAQIVYNDVRLSYPVDFLDFLQYADLSTNYSYLTCRKNKDNILNIDLSSSALTNEFIEMLAIQKEWERIFNEFFDNAFTPLITDLRSELHKWFEANSVEIPEKDRYCVWNLLDFTFEYIENRGIDDGKNISGSPQIS